MLVKPRSWKKKEIIANEETIRNIQIIPQNINFLPFAISFASPDLVINFARPQIKRSSPTLATTGIAELISRISIQT